MCVCTYLLIMSDKLCSDTAGDLSQHLSSLTGRMAGEGEGRAGWKERRKRGRGNS